MAVTRGHNQVVQADDRPYGGYIEGIVRRDAVGHPGPDASDTGQGW